MSNFLLNSLFVGPQKTGTTWLYKIFSQHPTICFPKNVKETMFFELYYKEGLSRYESYFSHRKLFQICAEVAPTYFDIREAVTRIHLLNPDCKILISLRHPVDRAFSLYCHHLRLGDVPPSFEKAIDKMPRILEAGHYKKHIPLWLNTFGRNKVEFVLVDDIEQKPKSVIFDICSFLNISESELLSNSSLYQKENKASMPKYPILATAASQTASFLRARQFDAVVEVAKQLGLGQVYSGGHSKLPQITSQQARFLTKYYESDVSYVEDILERNLSSWRRASSLD
jgi:hypothetical protein